MSPVRALPARPGRTRAALRALLRPALLGAGCAVLAACAAVPTSGPIEQGPVVDAGEATQFIRVIAAPPSVGASPTEIVRGFLEANASLESDHAIARRYLTQAASGQWDPTASTAVYEQASLELSGNGQNRVTATYSVTNRLESDGTLTPVDPPRTEQQQFRVERVDDSGSGVPQWRIADPPPGVLISEVDLRRAYRQYDTFFPSQRSSVLIPDGRLLPVVGPSLPTALAERVLAGPADWLAPGVRVAAPEGTELALGAVPVDSGVAVVDLTDQARGATDAQRRDLAAQLTWTLTQVPGISYVQLRAGGELLDIPGAPELMDRTAFQERNPDALTVGGQGTSRVPYYALTGSTLVRVSETTRTAVAIDVPGAEDLIELGVSLDQRSAAALSPDRRTMWVLPLDRAVSQREVVGEALSGASFDVDNHLWFTDEGRVLNLGAGTQATPVPILDESFRGQVSSVHLARDGARLALVSRGELYLGVISSEDSGLVISSVRRVAVGISDVRDVAWRSADTLEVIGSLDSRGSQVLRVTLGSDQAQQVGAPSDPREVSGAPSSSTLVTTEEDQLFANVGLQWREQGTARSVAYPG
jgi:hypothetical protein